MGETTVCKDLIFLGHSNGKESRNSEEDKKGRVGIWNRGKSCCRGQGCGVKAVERKAMGVGENSDVRVTAI